MRKCANPNCDKILEEVYKGRTLAYIEKRKYCSKSCGGKISMSINLQNPIFCEKNKKQAREMMLQLHQDPKFIKERNERASKTGHENLTKLWKNPEFRKSQSKVSHEVMTKLWKNSEFRNRRSMQARENVIKLNKTEKSRKLSRERLIKLNQNSEFAKNRDERFLKLNQNPEFARKKQEGASKFLTILNQNPEFKKKQRKISSEIAIKLLKDPTKNFGYSRNKTAFYKDVRMRSSWEVNFAKWCDENNVKWKYEDKTFLINNHRYTPDFYLPNIRSYVEIKPKVFLTNKYLEIQQELKGRGVSLIFVTGESWNNILYSLNQNKELRNNYE